MYGLPTTITEKGKEYHLSIAYGVHGDEWEVGYKRYFEYDTPDELYMSYGHKIGEAVKKLKDKLR